VAVSLTDLESLSQAAIRVDSNPIGLAGRLLGLSADEQRAGIPGYAWLGIGVGVGLLGGYFLTQSKILSRILDRG
jgi:hypothetical protein